jgi:hypothetical protein
MSISSAASLLTSIPSTYPTATTAALALLSVTSLALGYMLCHGSYFRTGGSDTQYSRSHTVSESGATTAARSEQLETIANRPDLHPIPGAYFSTITESKDRAGLMKGFRSALATSMCEIGQAESERKSTLDSARTRVCHVMELCRRAGIKLEDVVEGCEAYRELLEDASRSMVASLVSEYHAKEKGTVGLHIHKSSSGKPGTGSPCRLTALPTSPTTLWRLRDRKHRAHGRLHT